MLPAGDRGPDTRYCHVLHAVRHQKKRSPLSLLPSHPLPLSPQYRVVPRGLSVVARISRPWCRLATSNNAPRSSSGCLNNGQASTGTHHALARPPFRGWLEFTAIALRYIVPYIFREISIKIVLKSSRSFVPRQHLD